MVKKILVTMLAIFASTGVIAKADHKKVLKLNTNELVQFEIQGPYWNHFALAPLNSGTVITYVHKYRNADPNLPSDPVTLDCNSTPMLINPGSSAVCHYNQYSNVDWGVDEKYQKNGAEGFVVSVDQ
ncbi:MAG: hypothetical protein ACYCQI_00745 [Gammaproteobacteria bacterium]